MADFHGGLEDRADRNQRLLTCAPLSPPSPWRRCSRRNYNRARHRINTGRSWFSDPPKRFRSSEQKRSLRGTPEDWRTDERILPACRAWEIPSAKRFDRQKRQPGEFAISRGNWRSAMTRAADIQHSAYRARAGGIQARTTERRRMEGEFGSEDPAALHFLAVRTDRLCSWYQSAPIVGQSPETILHASRRA